jgi:hypothetical protein
LVNGLLVAIEAVVNTPFISWLASLAGALVVVSFALAKLSFGAKTFSQIMGFMITGLIKLVTQVGLTVLSFFELQAATISMFAPFAGGLVVIALLAAAWLLLKGPMNEVAQANKRVADQIKKTNAELASGATDGIGAVVDIYAKKSEEFNKLSFGGQFIFYATHITDVVGGMSETAILGAEALDTLGKSVYDLQQDLNADVSSGNLFDEDQLKALQSAKGDLQESKDLWGQLTAGTLEYNQAFVDTTQALDSSGSLWTNTITKINQDFDDGTISVAQYAGYMEQLGITTDETGAKVNLAALKIKGAGNTIAQALMEVQKESDTATGGLETFAEASGQSFLDLKKSALDAMTGTDGLLGTGTKVTQFFKDQAAVIEQWKIDTAEAFNFVKSALAGLADGSKVSFDKIRSTLQGAVQDAIDYGKNWRTLVKEGASQELLQQVKDLGQGGAEVLAGLVQGGKEGVKQVNALVARGATLSEALAANMADALGVSMDKMTTAIEFMISKLLDIPFKQVVNRVNHFMDDTKKTVEKKKPKFDIDVTRARGKLTAIEKHASGIVFKAPKFEVDTKNGEAKLAAIQQHGNAIDYKPPVLDVNTDPAMAALDNLGAHLETIAGKTYTVDIYGAYHRPATGPGGPPLATGGIIPGATGYITQGPSYLVGEGHSPTPAGPGAEAVIPLNARGKRIMQEAWGTPGRGKDAVIAPSQVVGSFRMLDWRRGIGSLDAELDWDDSTDGW